MKRSAFRDYVVSVAAALAVGGLSALLTMNSMTEFSWLDKPPLSPTAAVFPIVWSILFILMGIAAAMIWRSRDPRRGSALFTYGLQLFVNFFWTIIFFNMEMRLFAFFWLLLLLALVTATALSFKNIRPAAGALLIPYILWLCFAAYLNLGVYLLNR